MNKTISLERKTARSCALALAALLALSWNAPALTVHVVDASGAPITGPFRWLLEEDTTTLAVPGNVTNDSIGLIIHKSHAPVLTNGLSAVNPVVINIASTRRYFVSVLAEGYSVGAVNVSTGQTAATVSVNKDPIPTAQITFVAFVDHDPINNAIDEMDPPLGGCEIVVHDMLGPVSQDVFGHPLGTMYQMDTNGQFVLDGDGNPVVEMMGSGVIRTLTQREYDSGDNPYHLKVGEAVIKNLAPGKYGTVAFPPQEDDNGHPVEWVQTTTIEGTPVIDAWVASDEPTWFVEGFGTGFKHVAQGFIKLSPRGPSVINGLTIDTLPWNTSWPTGGTATVEGTLRLNHFSKPPRNQGYFAGAPVPEGWIGLNDPNAVPEVTPGGLLALPCDDNGHFVITNMPAGQYQLVSWDKPLDNLFGIHAVVPANHATFTVTNGAHIDLGDVLVFRWFGFLEGTVFYDADEDGFRDPDEPGIPQQVINLRFRNGAMYQTTVTRGDGGYELAEVFPFFKWLITEVDYGRFKPTGMTAVTDDGGEVPPDSGWAMPSDGVRTPQPQYQTDPVTGVALTNLPVINPNTGNNLSRTEVGPVLLEAQHLFLNQFNRIDWGKIDYPPGENGGIAGIAFYSTTRAEEDPRQAVGDPWEPGIPRVQFALYSDTNADKVVDDLDEDGAVTPPDVDNYPLGWGGGGAKGPEDIDRNGDGLFDTGDALQVVWSDSWDDWAEDDPTLGAIQVNPPVIHGKPIVGCDNYSTWNQIRPEVFDGGYFFGGVTPGMYIVQVFPPPGYLIQTEESFNVTLGESFKPSLLMVPVACVGTYQNHGDAAGDPYVARIVPANRTNLYTVANELSLFPDLGEPAPFAGKVRPLADMKWLMVADGKNTAADFHLYTEVPKAGRGVGFVLNDLGAEFNQGSPNYGEKLAAAWLPISIRDWTGKEIQRVYSDEYGVYNFLVPSTYNVHIPQPSGVSENMLTIVLNDPLLPNGTVDPYYNPMYVTAPWTFNYSPGGLSYLDTPIVPLAAFTTSEKRIDTEPRDHEPVIREVNGPEALGGPWISRTRTSGRQVTIASMGMTSVLNPDYNSSVPGSPLNILRDYGFGATTGSVTLCGVPLAVVSWATNRIVATVPTNAPVAGEILVTRGDNGFAAQLGVTLHSVNPATVGIHHVPADFASIQAAFDSPTVKAGDLVLVAPGVYNENVVMNKPVHLQGYGAGSTLIYGNPNPMQRLQAWHDRVDALGAQALANFLMKDPFVMNEAPVVLICGELEHPNGTLQIQQDGTTKFNPGHPFTKPGQAQLDGFSLLGSKAGGGVFVLGGARYTRISNNNIYGNQGDFAGGIAIGTSDVGFDSLNKNVVMHRNRIHRNSGIAGAGGISVYEASDDYVIEDNVLIGNFTRFNGAGIYHWGLCGGTNVIQRNQILFNENMYQALLFQAGDGGGLYINGDTAGGTGSGHVVVDRNLIQGNLTGSGKGGGICVFAANGDDVVAAPGNSAAWYRIDIFNNLIVNNIAAYAGGGITVEDSVRTRIIHNTIANNDSTATSGLLFNTGMTNSPPQGAGIVVYNLSATLAGALGTSFVSPGISNNILWHNRSFTYNTALNGGAGGLAPNPAGFYQDLAVSGAVTGQLNVSRCLLTSTAGYPNNNLSGDPLFTQPYTNVIETAAVIDEGGNNVNLRFLPISPTGNYRIGAGSPAVNRIPTNYLSVAVNAPLKSDFDGEYRPYAGTTDMGADEYSVKTITARNNFYDVNEDTLLSVAAPGVLGNDTGPAGLQAVLSKGPARGTLSLNANGAFTYTGAANYNGGDSFRYRARSGTNYSEEVEVCLTVKPVNDRPVAGANSYTVNGNTTLVVPAPGVLANDSDADGDPITSVRISGPSPSGTLTLNPDGSFTYTPLSAFSGPATFRYVAYDGVLASTPSTLVTINVTPRRPDFVVTAIGIVPQPVTTGATMTVQVTVKNQGSASGSAGRLTVWRNRPGADVAAGTPGDAFRNLGTLGIGASTTVVFTLNAPALPAPVENQTAPVAFRAYVNSQGTQTEFTQANNQMVQQYLVVTYGPAFADLPVDNDGVDTDGDGIVDNDVVYGHLAAGDGFAKMADGNELYTFGFSDHTAMAVLAAHTDPYLVLPMVMMDGMLKAECSSPTIVLKEGQKFYLDLTNVGMMMRPDLFDPHTVHFHGFPQAASIFDGEPMASIAINMGSTLRYYYEIVEPGTYLYHCHVEATEHMEMGMIGNLWVLPKQNNLPDGTMLGSFTHHAGYKYVYNDGDGSTYYDVEFPLQMGGFDRHFHELHVAVQPLPFAELDESYPLLNGRGYPDTLDTNALYNASADNQSQKVGSLIRATAGQKILLRVSNVSISDFHTLTVLGIPMKVVGKDARLLRSTGGQNLSYDTTSVTLGGGESTDVILDTTGVAPGTYFVYDARLNHLSNDQEDFGGMMTEIRIE